MSGVKTRTLGKGKKQDEGKEKKTENDNKISVGRMASGGEEGEATTIKAIQNLSRDIQNLKTELKQELIDFKDDIKQEFNSFRAEINQKLQNVVGDVRNQGTRLSEVEQRSEEIETANTELKDALLCTLKQLKLQQSKITDLEGRSRRNNIRIYGIKEDTEGSSMLTFIDNFMKTELALERNEDLQIQRAHRSIGAKPKDVNVSRSILVNFQRYDIKDKILKAAWAKKIVYEDRVIAFAHDLPTEVNNKMKEYKGIKKILKEKQIRFQTPYPAKMRIHWENGTRVYNTATEVAEEMRKRGYTGDLQLQVSDEANWEQRLTQGTHWSRRSGDRTTRVRERLKDYQRQQQDWN